MGGKGGVGKSSAMTGLAEWFDANEIPVTLLDLDTENKARGSLRHFFHERAPKVNIHTSAGLDAFVRSSGKAIPAAAGVRCDKPEGADRDALRVVKISCRCSGPGESPASGDSAGSLAGIFS